MSFDQALSLFQVVVVPLLLALIGLVWKIHLKQNQMDLTSQKEVTSAKEHAADNLQKSRAEIHQSHAVMWEAIRGNADGLNQVRLDLATNYVKHPHLDTVKQEILTALAKLEAKFDRMSS